MPQARETEKLDRLAAVAACLSARPAEAEFAALLYARGAAEDLVACAAEDLAALADDAWRRLQTRRLGRPTITVENPVAATASGAVTVVEILNDNMPFLVDSVMGELTESGHGVRLVLHPILTVRRTGDGRLAAFGGAAPALEGESRESLIHIHVDRIASEEERAALAARLEETLRDVRNAVTDWRSMLARVDKVIAAYRADPPPLPTEETSEAVQFLQWLRDDNFTFLGTRDYVHRAEDGDDRVERIPESGLGLLIDPAVRVLRRGSEAVNDSIEMRDFLRSTRAMVVTKANLRSRVHRRVHLDYIGIKLFEGGALSGELRLLGLFTSTAYTRSTRTIPFIRLKIDRAIARAGFDTTGHSGKALINVLEGFPRDELFQIDDATLYDFAMQILALDEHPRVRVLARRDTFDRFVSVLVYVPRDRYSTDVRIRIGDYLEQAFAGRVANWQPAFPEGSLSRVHFIVGRYEGSTPSVAQEELEQAVAAIVRTWTDGLADALELERPEAAATILARYRGAFGAAYREAYDAATAVGDIRMIDRLGDGRRITIDFYRRADDPALQGSLKLFSLDHPIPLSDRVPILENMGLRVISERTYRIEPADGRHCFLHDMVLERADGQAVLTGDPGDQRIEALFMAVWSGAVENDGFNALGFAAGLGHRAIAILRAYARFLRQIGIPYSLDYIWGTLGRHPAVAADLVALFEARFDPAAEEGRAAREAERVAAIETALDAVASLDDDTILRRLLNVVRSTLRTNCYQLDDDGQPRETFAFKLESRAITGLPDPKPLREIWVYSPRVEGVHTRFGKVARGGLRWSDRAQDFRTEVLGLVKAQQVKNAVIVPAGAKGGFLPRRLVPGMARDAWMAEGTAAYRLFVSSLLTVTDNLGPDGVVPPRQVVRHEGDDPYLVVAADKGTATFSDTANAIAEAHGYWLGDAFASGGSAGYDHKKMGITARGAFEAVKRHFREMDVDIMATPFSVAGVGDMSGDVFGNGMLLAPTIRLVAAFDHRDIFIDPDPDTAASFAERRRLFGLPRSSWADYERGTISAGGGVFSRAAKAIDLSPEARALLGLAEERPTPQAVMRAILKLPVDLLWFGGIGTYIRAADESDADAGDKANDSIRITADAVRAKVIGEGANLGMTQRARIAYGLAGGRSNSDAIDNSAGVNSSDLEVNIKIALGSAVRSGRLDIAARNALLASMTDEVAALVLANNYRQPLAISVAARRGMEDFGYQRRFMQGLERSGGLDRAVEYLPDDAALARREKAGLPLTRAEIGVLLAYAKMMLKEALIESDVPDDAYFAGELRAYFPPTMREAYGAEIDGHRLRREIIATRLANTMIDRGGPTLVTRIADQAGAEPPAIARAFVAALDVFDLVGLDDAVDALDNRIGGGLQLRLYAAVQDMALGGAVWFLRHVDDRAGLAAVVERFRAGVAALKPRLAAMLPAGLADAAALRAAALVEAGAPSDLAARIAHLPEEAAIPDVVLVAERAGVGLEPAAAVYFGLAERFRIGRLMQSSWSIPIVDYYDGLALDRARDLLADSHRAIAAATLAAEGGLEGWLAAHAPEVERTLAAVSEITGTDSPTVSRFAVAAGLVSDLAAA